MGASKEPATRASAAVALRTAGAPYPQIAQTLGYATGKDAQNAVESILAATVDEDDLHTVRMIEGERLNRLLQSTWSQAINPANNRQLEYARFVLAVQERRSRLFGLDAPTKHEVYTPTTEQIAAEVARIRAQVPGPVEAEIIDVDIVDEDPPGDTDAPGRDGDRDESA